MNTHDLDPAIFDDTVHFLTRARAFASAILPDLDLSNNIARSLYAVNHFLLDDLKPGECPSELRPGLTVDEWLALTPPQRAQVAVPVLVERRRAFVASRMMRYTDEQTVTRRQRAAGAPFVPSPQQREARAYLNAFIPWEVTYRVGVHVYSLRRFALDAEEADKCPAGLRAPHTGAEWLGLSESARFCHMERIIARQHREHFEARQREEAAA